ncbi:MAG: type II toxin-antitoxin system RelE/ParE family toxin [Bacteroidia bacterium]
MVKEIIWTKRADAQLTSVYYYLVEKWSKKVANDFALKVKLKVSRLKEFPEIGRPTDSIKRLRKLIVTRYNYVLYEIRNEQIFIHSLCDMRQENK